MNRTLAIVLVFLTALLLNGSAPPSSYDYNTILERELQKLTERGLHASIHGNVVEVLDPISKQRWHWPLTILEQREPAYTGLPTLAVDLRTLDTNQFNWKYHYHSTFPASSEWGFPLQVGDVDGNKYHETYGVYQTQTAYRTRIYEFDSSGFWSQRHTYPIDTGIPDKQGDLNLDGKKEVYFRFRDNLFGFEQSVVESLPTLPWFTHRQWFFGATGIPNQVFNIDSDSFPEILYQGSEPDSLNPPTGEIRKTYVTRYSPTNGSLERIWSEQLPADCAEFSCVSAIACGDLDGDNGMDFVTSAEDGGVFIVEHVVEDSFAVVWTDSLSIARRVAIGDVDGNGISEFFVGAEQPEADGFAHLRIYAYERAGDNSYKPVFGFNIYPVALFFVSLFQTADVDGDGKPELILSFGGGPVILKGIGTHSYEVFYYTQAEYLDAVSMAPIGKGTVPALFVSRHLGGQPIVKVTDVYELDSSLVTSVERDVVPQQRILLQNYPNPFNGKTTIIYELEKREFVQLSIYDLAGQKITRLVSSFQEAGSHAMVWDVSGSPEGSALSSGLYICRLKLGDHVLTKKMLYVK